MSVLIRRGLSFVGAVLLVTTASLAEDRRQDKSRLVIMTLNAEFLWDGVEPEEGQPDFFWKGSQTEAEGHMQEVAEIIIRANPDILNLKEIENGQSLGTLNNKFLAGRGYLPYFVQGKDTYAADAALLTRIDPAGNAIERDDRTGESGGVQKSLSKNYFAKFDTRDGKFALIGIHILAQPLNHRHTSPWEAGRQR